MATRAYTVSWAHVEALNRIDLEFDRRSRKERAVLDAWREYLDLLNNDKMPVDQWGIRRIDLLAQLLYKMAIVLDYDFDKTQIKNSFYSPRAHGDIEIQHEALRRGIVELLEGRRSIPMHITNLPQQSEN